MQVVKPNVEILDPIQGFDALRKIELAGRICYKSEDKITDDSAPKFVSNILKRGHESVIEHVNITAKVICDRGVTHEIVRHRLASYSQESTRYCNYSSGHIQFIKPCWCEGIKQGIYVSLRDFERKNEIHADTLDDGMEAVLDWAEQMLYAEKSYKNLIALGWSPQQARSVLPNSLKTEIVITMNLREWRHFFSLRCSKKAHPQMQEIANMLWDEMVEKGFLVVFQDVGPLVSC